LDWGKLRRAILIRLYFNTLVILLLEEFFDSFPVNFVGVNEFVVFVLVALFIWDYLVYSAPKKGRRP